MEVLTLFLLFFSGLQAPPVLAGSSAPVSSKEIQPTERSPLATWTCT